MEEKDFLTTVIILKAINKNGIRSAEFMTCNNRKLRFKLAGLGHIGEDKAGEPTEKDMCSTMVIIDREEYKTMFSMSDSSEYKVITDQDFCYDITDAVYETCESRITLTDNDCALRVQKLLRDKEKKALKLRKELNGNVAILKLVEVENKKGTEMCIATVGQVGSDYYGLYESGANTVYKICMFLGNTVYIVGDTLNEGKESIVTLVGKRGDCIALRIRTSMWDKIESKLNNVGAIKTAIL